MRGWCQRWRSRKMMEFFRGPPDPHTMFFPQKLRPETCSGMVVHNLFGPSFLGWVAFGGRGRWGCKFYFVKTWCKGQVFTDSLVVQARKKFWRKDQTVLMKYFFESGCFYHQTFFLDQIAIANAFAYPN